MADTPYKIVAWSDDELVTADKLNTMASNADWIKNHMVKGLYSAFNMNKKDGVKIASGMKLVPEGNKQSDTVTVRFNSFFNGSCKPVVTTGIVSSHQRRIFVSLDGIGRAFPDSNGFQIHAFIEAEADKNKKIKHNFHVSWIAVGW